MELRTQRTLDKYLGGLAIACLRPATMLLGALLRRDHRLMVDREVVWVKMLGGGSLLLAMPMLLGIRKAHPHTKLVLVTTTGVEPFARLLGVFDEYRIVENRNGPLQLVVSTLRAWMRTLRADCIVDLEVYSRLTTVFATLTLARNRVSFWLEDIFWRRGLSSHLVFFNRSSGSYHFYDRIGALFGTAPATRAECRAAVLASCGIEPHVTAATEQVCVGFACSDLGQERMLTPAQWLDVFRANVRAEHRAFRFLGGPDDRRRATEIIAALSPHWPELEFVNDCGSHSLAGSIRLVFESAEFWGIDSGLLHVARMAGARCVSYWGPTDPATRLRPEWEVDEQIHYRKIACSPCVHTSQEPPCRGDNRCIRGLFESGSALSVNWTPLEHPPMRTPLAASVRSLVAALWRNAGYAAAALMLVYLFVHAFDPPRLNWGDPGSDFNVMTAGRNFAKYGFVTLRFTPFLIDPAVMTAADRALIYTHYPQLPDLMNGLLRVLLGFDDLVQFRLVALAFSFGGLYFVYRLVALYWSRAAAQVTLLLWVVNPLWIQYADYLHYAPYLAFFGFGSVLFLAQHLRGGRAPAHLAAAGVFLCLAYMSCYDAWFFVPLLLVLVAVDHYRSIGPPALRTLGALAPFAVAAIVLKIASNVWVLGGVGPFIRDLKYQLVERATGTLVRTPLASGVWPTLVGRTERCFSLLLFGVMAFWALVPFFRARWARVLPGLERRQVNPYVLLAAALPFLCLFVQLWVSQYAPTLLVLPFYAVACAALVVLLLQTNTRWPRSIGAALAFALVANSVIEDASFKKSYFSRDSIQSLGRELDARAAPGQYIMTNHLFDFMYMHYFSHATVDIMMDSPQRFRAALAYYSDPSRPRVAPPSGALFVQHKHLADELFDKNLYYLLGRQGLWWAWGNPERYRPEIDTLVTQRDSLLMAEVAAVGEKVYETDAFAIWRIAPRSAARGAGDPGAPAGSTAGSAASVAEHDAHLAKVERHGETSTP